MLADALEAVGIARGDYMVRINSRKVLNGVLEAAEVRAEQAESVLRQIDKFDKVGREKTYRLNRNEVASRLRELADLIENKDCERGHHDG